MTTDEEDECVYAPDLLQEMLIALDEDYDDLEEEEDEDIQTPRSESSGG